MQSAHKDDALPRIGMARAAAPSQSNTQQSPSAESATLAKAGKGNRKNPPIPPAVTGLALKYATTTTRRWKFTPPTNSVRPFRRQGMGGRVR